MTTIIHNLRNALRCNLCPTSQHSARQWRVEAARPHCTPVTDSQFDVCEEEEEAGKICKKRIMDERACGSVWFMQRLGYASTHQKNKKFWQKLIRLLSLRKVTADNLAAMVTVEHKQSTHTHTHTMLSKAHLTTLNLGNFKMTEAMGLKIISLRPI
jgi:hypothetical protein